MSSLALDPIQLVIMLGALQGLLLAVALVTRRPNRTANRLLAAAMLSFSLYLAFSVYHSAGLFARYPLFFGLGYPILFLFGPLVYLYSVAAADRDWRMTPVHWLHFLPFVAVSLMAAPVVFMSVAETREYFRELTSGKPNVWSEVIDPLKHVLGLSYGVATVLLLRRHRRRVKDSYSSTERVTLRWLMWLAGAAAGTWGLATAFRFVELLGFGIVQRGDDVISLIVAVIVYAIGYLGLRQPEIFRYATAEHRIVSHAALDMVAAPVAPSALAPASDVAVPRYARSGLTAGEARRLKAQLLDAMDRHRPWTNGELTLADLAGLLNTTPHKLSEVLNGELEETFYDFVNGYRVRDVQRRIAAGEARSRKMLALALDAGFSSKSTFNQVFKKHTGNTPTDYRRDSED